MEALGKGHIFYSLNCTAKTLIYDDKKTTLPLTSSAALQKMKEDVKATFMSGFNKAFSFYQSAVYIQEFNQSPIMLFFLHQSTEFIYRSILRSLGGYDKQTHSIRRLKIHAQHCAPQLNAILPDNSTVERRIMDLLEDGHIKPRYENGYSVDNNDISSLFSKVRHLQACAKGIVEDAIVSVT
jgi:HEPN domain-containing protein